MRREREKMGTAEGATSVLHGTLADGHNATQLPHQPWHNHK